jgi:hypothetical protein
MGAWGVGPFDNDDAQDFVLDLAEAPAQELGQRLADALTLPDDYIEAPEASTAVAAAALVAIGAGMAVPDSPSVSALVDSRTIPASPELREAGRAALKRVAGGDSELRELWQDAGLTDEVSASHAEIRAAL